MNESLQTSLRKLRLSGLAQSLDVRLQEAAGHGLNHVEFLELVLQDELVVRNERLMDRRIKTAAFREMRTLDDFDFSFNTSIKKKQIFDLATCKFIRDTRDVLLLGPPETPTYCTTSLCACKQGHFVLRDPARRGFSSFAKVRHLSLDGR
jgi:DNA replication protein DnaC